MDANARDTAKLDTVEAVVQAGAADGGISLHSQVRGGVVPQQLPLSPPWLVGREHEMAQLSVALTPRSEAVAILAIEGQGGVGKSTLALYWAHHNRGTFPDGQLYVDLGGFDRYGVPATPLAVLHTFLGALGVDPADFPPDVGGAAALYRSVLSGKRALVVLDNAVDTAQILPLLPGSASCAVLVTSRNSLASLRMRGASLYRLDVLTADSARELLFRHIGEEAAGAEPAEVDGLLDCCAGLPLAVALVAARLASQPELPLSVVYDELREAKTRLDMFEAGDSTGDLRAVLSWSYRTLSRDEAAGFRLLGRAPVAEFGIAAAASLLAVTSKRAAELLRSLELKNLIRQYRAKRYRMHELVRLYAGELADECERPLELAAASLRLVDFYLYTALRADRLLYPYRKWIEPAELAEGCIPLQFSGEAESLRWFDDERLQLLAVQRMANERNLPGRVWHLSRALDTYQYRCGHIHDNVETSSLGVDAAEKIESTVIRAMAYRQLGRAQSRAGDLEHALINLNYALALTEDSINSVEQAHSHHDLGRVYALQGTVDLAIRHATRALELYRIGGNSVGEAHALNAIARQCAKLDDHDRAREYASASLALHEKHGNVSGTVASMDNLGSIAQGAGKVQEASEWYLRALDLTRRQGNCYFQAEVIEHLAEAQLSVGRAAEGNALLRQAYELYVAQHRLPEAERVRRRLAG